MHDYGKSMHDFNYHYYSKDGVLHGFGLRVQYEIPELELDSDEQYVLRFSFQYFDPLFVINDKKIGILEEPRHNTYPICCLPDSENPNCRIVTLDETAETLQKTFISSLERRLPEEANFRNIHTSVYQGKIDKRAKKLWSDIWNYGQYSLRWNSLVLPPIDSIGLTYKGSVSCYYYNEELNGLDYDGCLDIFKNKDKEIVVIKCTKRKSFSLVQLAAEKISESLSDQAELEILVKETGIPTVCAERIKECL